MKPFHRKQNARKPHSQDSVPDDEALPFLEEIEPASSRNGRNRESAEMRAHGFADEELMNPFMEEERPMESWICGRKVA